MMIITDELLIVCWKIKFVAVGQDFASDSGSELFAC